MNFRVFLLAFESLLSPLVFVCAGVFIPASVSLFVATFTTIVLAYLFVEAARAQSFFFPGFYFIAELCQHPVSVCVCVCVASVTTATHP